MKKITVEEQQILTAFMEEHQLTPESKLYRYTSKDYIIELNDHLYIQAKKEPSDLVVDRYHGYWEVFLASEIGAGISFLSDMEKEYERSDRLCVELKLKDVLDQGGLIYTITSLPSYIKAFFCTLPEGKVKVLINNEKT